MNSVILVLIVFIASTALLLTNRIRYDLVGIGTVVVIVAAGLVTPTLAMAEFASLPVFLLGMVMVISKTISDSGVMEKFGMSGQMKELCIPVNRSGAIRYHKGTERHKGPEWRHRRRLSKK